MKFVYTILFILALNVARAQQPRYFVFLAKGEVYIKQPGTAGSKARLRQFLTAKDSILMKDENAVLTIGISSGNSVQLKGKGAYSLPDIMKKGMDKAPGITPKFLHFLYEEFLLPKRAQNKFSQQAVAASWGAGSRGPCEFTKTPVNDNVTSADSVCFTWKHIDKTPDYEFVLYTEAGDELFNCRVRDTQLIVQTAFLKKADQSKYAWSINAVSDPCLPLTKHYFELVSVAEEEKRVADLLNEHVMNEDEIMNNLEMADLLGKNGFTEKAYTYFIKAFLLLLK